MLNDLSEIILLSLEVSGIALLLSALIGLPIGISMAWGITEGAGWSRLAIHRHGLSPVVIGLFVYLCSHAMGCWVKSIRHSSRSLYTRSHGAGTTIIAFPLVAGFTMAAVIGVDPQLRLQVLSLGATKNQAAWLSCARPEWA
jgi:tungstate transport system permease protein